MPRAGGLRVEAERAGHRGELGGQVSVHLLRGDGPQRPATVPDGVPAVLLQHLAALPGLGDHAQHVNTGPVGGGGRGGGGRLFSEEQRRLMPYR